MSKANTIERERAGHITPSPQRVLDRLAMDDGPVDQWDLMREIDARPTTSSTVILRVYIARIRAEIGYACVRNIWGYGYQLTETGRRVLSERESDGAR